MQWEGHTALYSKVNWKYYCTHFLYCPVQLSWLDFTAPYRPLRCVTLSLLSWYKPKWRRVYVFFMALWSRFNIPTIPWTWECLASTFFKSFEFRIYRFKYLNLTLLKLTGLYRSVSTLALCYTKFRIYRFKYLNLTLLCGVPCRI